MDHNDHREAETDDDHECYADFIRPSSSSSLRAPSWSLGFGADLREALGRGDDEFQEGENCCRRSVDSSKPLVGGQCRCSCCCCSHNSSNATNCGNSHQPIIPACPRFSVEIPYVYLTRKDSTNPSSNSSFHVYQVNVKTSTQAVWSVYRRYSQFLTLHQQLKAAAPAIGKFSFPPKRRLNSKASTIVQERRRKLEEYLRKVCDFVVDFPVESLDSGSYQMLNNLATNGPIKLAPASSRSGGSESLYETPCGGGDEDGACTISDQLEGDSGSNVEVQGDDDENDTSNNVQEADNSSLRSTSADRGSTNESTGNNNQIVSGKNKCGKSVRYLFYNFISPIGTSEAEFELDNLGM